MRKVKFKISRERIDCSTNSIDTIGYPFGEKMSNTFIIPYAKINSSGLSNYNS